MTYNNLLEVAESEKIEVYEYNFESDIKGLYYNDAIGISSNLDTTSEKKCVLAEELGHYYTSSGDILNQSNLCNKKQEIIARRWAHEELVPLQSIIDGSFSGCRNLYELSEYLEVTEDFLQETLEHYKNKYGLYTEINDYCIYFSPLTVCKYKFK